MSDINEKSNFVFEFQPVTNKDCLKTHQVRLHTWDKCAVGNSMQW